MKITVGIPAFNEEKNIAPILTKLSEIVDAIIVCNDGSSDETGKIAKKMGAIVINHEKNLGYGAAIRSIFLKAREINSDILVTMDADGQHRIEDVKRVIEPILKNEVDIVIGTRFHVENEQNIRAYRKTGIRVITGLINTTLEKKITDSQSGFRAYNKQVLTKILPSDYGMGVSTEILIKASREGFRIGEIPITILYEGDTSTHNPVPHGLSVILTTMKFISIEHPLKFYGIPGFVFLAIGLGFMVWTLQVFGETRQIITNISLISIGAILVGIVFIMTATMLYSIVNLIREQSKS